MRAHLLLATTLLVALADGTTTGASAESRDATGCTWSDSSTTGNCIHVRSKGGSGPDITYIRVSRIKASGSPPFFDTICNYRMEAVVRTPGGVQLDRFISPTSPGCVPGGAAADFYPQRSYPNGSRICGYVYESGVLTPGHPCETVLGRADPARGGATECPIIASREGLYGDVLITSEGDIFVGGATYDDLYYDCPPYNV